MATEEATPVTAEAIMDDSWVEGMLDFEHEAWKSDCKVFHDYEVCTPLLVNPLGDGNCMYYSVLLFLYSEDMLGAYTVPPKHKDVLLFIRKLAMDMLIKHTALLRVCDIAWQRGSICMDMMKDLVDLGDPEVDTPKEKMKASEVIKENKDDVSFKLLLPQYMSFCMFNEETDFMKIEESENPSFLEGDLWMLLGLAVEFEMAIFLY